jgi:hypothetical protein
MEKIANLQDLVFDKIREVLPPYESLVDTISDILNISNDSAYRRIRGEKTLNIDEFILLCKRYSLSADELFQIDNNQVCFNYFKLHEKDFSFESYLETIYIDLKNLLRQGNPQLYLIFNEINIFQILQFPTIAAFKFFFWSKSNLAFPGYDESVFSLDHISNSIQKLCKDIVELYIQVPSIELISTEFLSSMIKQLEFYYEARFFKNRDDILMLCDDLTELLAHLKKQAELGFKFAFNTKPVGIEGNYRLFLNELVIVDNTVIAISNKSIVSYITNNVVNLLVSNNKLYCTNNLRWAKNLVGKSTLISGAAERDRIRYFNKMNELVNEMKSKICR